MSRPFVDRPVDDLAAATALAQRAARAWDLPQPALLRQGMNAIFTAGDSVLRVGKPNAPATASMALARSLSEQGLRVAQPVRDDVITGDGLSASCWERIEPSESPIDWREVGRMVRVLHDLDATVVPADYPISEPTAFPWWNFDRLLGEVGESIDEQALAGIRAAIARWPHWHDARETVVCHGDVHPGNVVMSDAGPVLIDWDLLCRAPRGWDHAPMLTWADRWGGEPGTYEQLAAGYGASLADEPETQAFAELRLVAATLMRVRAGLANPAARPEADRRLEFWRGDAHASMWRAQ